jgi:cell wall-associated NlpC family hydrolase
MRYIISTLFVVIVGLCFGFSQKRSQDIVNENRIVKAETPATGSPVEIATTGNDKQGGEIFSQVRSSDYVAFAKTLIGTPYVYGSVDPAKGFDCSGFINYVSRHFGMKVPRSSVDFTNFGTTIEAKNALPGDLILFTGTDASRHIVGHMGIVTDNINGAIQFIHSSSGHGKGVIMSDLSGYYETRFVKIIRILPSENS